MPFIQGNWEALGISEYFRIQFHIDSKRIVNTYDYFSIFLFCLSCMILLCFPDHHNLSFISAFSSTCISLSCYYQHPSPEGFQFPLNLHFHWIQLPSPYFSSPSCSWFNYFFCVHNLYSLIIPPNGNYTMIVL